MPADPMTHVPKVSVVTPLYNHRPYLAERVRSILGQTLSNIEWIIVDDASTDGSYQEVCRLTAEDDRVRVLRNPVNVGVTEASEKGFGIARGAYLYRTDSDDSCAPEFLERTSEVLDRCPDVGMVYCRGLTMDARGGVWGGVPPRKGYFRSGKDEFANLVLRGNYIKSPTVLFRRPIVEAAGGFNVLPLRINWDMHLYLRVFLRSDVAFLGQPLAYYRTHDTNISKTHLKAPDVGSLELECFRLIEDVFDRIPDELGDLRALRGSALESAARRLVPLVHNAQERGSTKEAAEITTLLHKYAPDLVIDGPRLDVRRRLRKLAAVLIKQLTYRANPF